MVTLTLYSRPECHLCEELLEELLPLLPPTVNVMGTLLFGAGLLLAAVSVLASRRRKVA